MADRRRRGSLAKFWTKTPLTYQLVLYPSAFRPSRQVHFPDEGGNGNSPINVVWLESPPLWGSASAGKLAIRSALDNYGWPQETRYKVFLQGSYQNATNLSGGSDVDVVIQLASRIRPRVAALSPAELDVNDAHNFALIR